MPIIRSAIKKMRKDKTRTARNKKREVALKSLIKKARNEKSEQSLQAVFSALDKAAKVHLIHHKKADRLKSRLSKGTSQSSSGKLKKTTKKKVIKKSKTK